MRNPRVRGYHFNPKTGNTGICSAKKRCKFAKGDELPPHYETAADASAAYQEIMQSEILAPVAKKKRGLRRRRSTLPSPAVEATETPTALDPVIEPPLLPKSQPIETAVVENGDEANPPKMSLTTKAVIFLGGTGALAGIIMRNPMNFSRPGGWQMEVYSVVALGAAYVIYKLSERRKAKKGDS